MGVAEGVCDVDVLGEDTATDGDGATDGEVFAEGEAGLPGDKLGLILATGLGLGLAVG